MSELQVAESAEVVVPLDRLAAEKLDARIRRMAESARGQLVKVAELVEEAKRGRVHEVLGYESWTAYLANALGGQLQLEGDARHEVVSFLAGEGMSVRAIAAATGVSKSTVDRDLAQVSQTRTPATGGHAGSGVPQRDTSNGDRSVGSITPEVTGLDGKQYPRHPREPKPPPATPNGPRRTPRKPITEAFAEAAHDLTKVAERIGRLAEDDRFAKNANALTSRASDIIRSRETLDRVICRFAIEGSDLRSRVAAINVLRELVDTDEWKAFNANLTQADVDAVDLAIGVLGDLRECIVAGLDVSA